MRTETSSAVRAVPSYPFPVAGPDPTDWDFIVAGGSNALLCGPPAALEAALSTLRPHLLAPLQKWSGGGQESLPNLPARTLILEHVAAFTFQEQQALLAWLDAAKQPVQVITTTGRPLFDLVEQGVLLEGLYYRLNTVHLDFYGSSAVRFGH
jgi:hypothetical protein